MGYNEAPAKMVDQFRPQIRSNEIKMSLSDPRNKGFSYNVDFLKKEEKKPEAKAKRYAIPEPQMTILNKETQSLSTTKNLMKEIWKDRFNLDGLLFDTKIEAHVMP